MSQYLPDIPVIYFHSIGDTNSSWSRGFLSASTENTERFFRYLSGRYTPIHLKEYYNLRAGLSKGIKNPVVITFDDGYLDNWLHAFPLLKKYSLKATIFVSPDYVDRHEIIRSGGCPHGYLSWQEMREMETSGLIDIQSHTLTHTKYFTSDKLTGFHHPGNDILYIAGNLHPEIKPDCTDSEKLEKIVPFGYPLFKEESAVVARRVTINSEFIEEVISGLAGYDFSRYSFSEAFAQIGHIYERYRRNDMLIVHREGEEEYIERIRGEIAGSKEIIERSLGKKVEFLCWPHGDNNSFLHGFAIDTGYLMTTIGHSEMLPDEIPSRIPERLGIDYTTFRRRLKTIFKLKALSGKFPFRQLMILARSLKSCL